jgi:hypothetical protein
MCRCLSITEANGNTSESINAVLGPQCLKTYQGLCNDDDFLGLHVRFAVKATVVTSSIFKLIAHIQTELKAFIY